MGNELRDEGGRLIEADAVAECERLRHEAADVWQPIETAPKDDYVTVLVAVPLPDGGYDHRLAMWDPEGGPDDGGWNVFMANWDPIPEFWMPLPALPRWGDRTNDSAEVPFE
jgi:hypothetical protein